MIPALPASTRFQPTPRGPRPASPAGMDWRRLLGPATARAAPAGTTRQQASARVWPARPGRLAWAWSVRVQPALQASSRSSGPPRAPTAQRARSASSTSQFVTARRISCVLLVPDLYRHHMSTVSHSPVPDTQANSHVHGVAMLVFIVQLVIMDHLPVSG